jgi:hypothetical protein
LHSIMPSPVRSRSSLTMLAVMSAILARSFASIVACAVRSQPSRTAGVSVKNAVQKKGACAPLFLPTAPIRL